MKIKANLKRVPFESISVGKCFCCENVSPKNVCVKIKTIKRDDGFYFNAINLKSGDLVRLFNPDKIIYLPNAELNIFGKNN